MSRRTILLVDDDARFRDTLAERLGMRGFEVISAASGQEALELSSRHDPGLAVVDMRMPGMDGLVTITKLKERRPGMRTLLLTAHGGDKLREATEALESEYFEKQDMHAFWDRLTSQGGDSRFIIMPQTQQEKDTTSREETAGDVLIGQTEAMQQIKEDLEKVAALDCTVLLLGETGSGKELIARAIHQGSLRGGERFLAVNCGSFSHDLLSRELFGQEPETPDTKGSKGVFEAISGGTILLDEVGDTPLPMQSQLLRLLQDRKVIRVGGGDEIPVDVRIMAASNQDLGEKIRTGEFREDFYYRLNVFTLHIPPLRKRRDDIPPLCNYFLAKYNAAFNKDVEDFEPEVMSLLMEYDYPGNVRELENIVERAVIIRRKGPVRLEDLPQRFQAREAHFEPHRQGDLPLGTLAEVEENHIRRVLKATGGSRNEMARILGISRAGLWRKLKKMEEEGGASG